MTERGKYIVIEGHDGTGKSAQRDLLTQRVTAELGVEVMHTYEPGGTEISDRIRSVIKDGELVRDGLTNLLLFTASRRESWNQVIKPALDNGKWVIADRSWYSSLVYQGYGEGVDLDLITETTRTFVSQEYLTPDIAIILALSDEQERQKRTLQSADIAKDTFEQRDADFQNRITDGYLLLAKTVGATAIEFSATSSRQDISNEIWAAIVGQIYE